MLKYLLTTLCCLTLFGSGEIFGQALETRVNVNAKNLSIKEILQQIESTTSIRFSYSDDVVPVDKRINLNLKNVPLKQALNQIFANTFIDFRENQNQILLFRKKLNLDKNQSYTISGFIREATSGEPLMGVNIARKGTWEGTSTNAYGYYSLSSYSDTFHLQISYIGFKTIEQFILLDQNVELNILMEDDAKLGEVLIAAPKTTAPEEITAISKMEIPIPQIQDIPALFGEKDVFKAIKLMPGIQSGNEGQSGFYVRGGGPDQNLIILDDATVYNAFHLFGFFSLFNGDALRSVELTKGGFPARYGGRLSSVLDVHMKDGNKEEFHGSGGIGIISSRITLEGPIKKNVSSFLISGRRTYLDMVIQPFFSDETVPTFYFYDITAKADWVFSDKDKLFLSFYHGRDRYYINSGNKQFGIRGGTNWENLTSTLRWNHVVNSRLFSNTSLVLSNYKLRVESGGTYDYKKYLLKLYSGITDISLKSDFDYNHSARRKMRFGAISTFHYFVPQGYYELNEVNGRELQGEEHYPSQESAIYLEDDYQITSKFSSGSGLRFTHFIASGKSYVRAEPRLLLRYELDKKNAFKVSYTLMNQFVHLLSTTGIGLPTDLWVPSTKSLAPQQGHQIAGGYGRSLKRIKTFLTIEAYYKKSNGVIGYKEGATFVEVSADNEPIKVNWEQNVTQGQSWSYGTEVLLQKKVGKLSGWIGYTLSWTWLQFDELNRGEKFYARYDRRHDISVVGIYHVSERLTISGTWVYGTGNAITLPESRFYAVTHDPNSNGYSSGINGLIVSEYGLKNQYRMSPYHRLDFGLQYHTKHKKWEGTWEFSIYNAYNRKNPYFYYVSTDGNGENTLKQMSFFPILPSISYSFKF